MTLNEKIETDIAYLQNQLLHLDEVVTGLQGRVARLEKQNEFLKGKLDEIEEERPDRKPPHY